MPSTPEKIKILPEEPSGSQSSIIPLLKETALDGTSGKPPSGSSIAPWKKRTREKEDFLVGDLRREKALKKMGT